MPDDSANTLNANPFDHRIKECLRELYELSSHQARARGDAVGKDSAAYQALRNASEILRLTAGWALDHYRGLAIKDMRPGPPASHESSGVLDSHAHEEASWNLNTNELAPAQGRRFLRNLLLTIGYNLNIPNDLVQAIEALDFGQVLPPLEPKPTGDRLGLTTRRARLAAVAYVEYEHQKTGVKKEYIWEEVAKLFATNPESMKDWRGELRNALGKDQVNKFLAQAGIAGRSYREHSGDTELEYVIREMHDETYGTRVLLQAAEVYKRRSG